jgi:hypothetical protein
LNVTLTLPGNGTVTFFVFTIEKRELSSSTVISTDDGGVEHPGVRQSPGCSQKGYGFSQIHALKSAGLGGGWVGGGWVGWGAVGWGAVAGGAVAARTVPAGGSGWTAGTGRATPT